MKKITFLLVAISLLIAFAGCNKKDKKLEKIADNFTIIRTFSTK